MKLSPGVAAGVVGAAVVVVAGVLFSLQNFNAGAVACEDIPQARNDLQALYDAGVEANVAVYAESRAHAEARLSACINATPEDPCEAKQRARDEAVANFNSIESPPNTASYAEFQSYFSARESAYHTYKTAKGALDLCRSANPPPAEVSYEQSDTKACFDEYDASMSAAQAVFTRDTQALRSALASALAALAAREKACNPPTGDTQFTALLKEGDAIQGTESVFDLSSCRLINAEFDATLSALRARASALPAEIQSVEETLESVQKRINRLRTDVQEVDTYIPPESTKTQFEGALNALRGERKASLESAIEFYENLRARKEAEREMLEEELQDIEEQIRARLADIERENAERQRKYPTVLRRADPHSCQYYHCHGTLCGIPDPAPDGCGHGVTTEADLDCSHFFDAYLDAAGK